MSPRRSAAIARHEFRIFLRDPVFFVIFLGMPLLLMSFLKPAFRDSVEAEGFATATGAEQAVPGLTVMFAFFLVGNVGFGFMREHGWNTWERLRSSWASPAELIIGKTVVPFGMAVIHTAVLLTLGMLLFGLDVPGSKVGLVAVALALDICLIALGFALVALCNSVMQLNAFANLGAILFSGLGGALAPLSDLPGWARAIAPATPSYWAMRGFRTLVLDRGGVGDVMLPVGVLLAFAAGFSVVALARFRVEETKTAWA